nr:integrase, catalytic region, zinc finger, CCHC-type, peptidase aspartic, catalytic [Tanacetum cinerariifolium]
MTGDRSQLINFVQKFLGTVKFRNDHVAKIMGYGNYQIGNVIISRSSLGPALNDMTPGEISLGLVQKSSSSASYVPPVRNDWDLLFQPIFDELLNPPPSVANQTAEVIAPTTEVILKLMMIQPVRLSQQQSIKMHLHRVNLLHQQKYNPQLFFKMLEMII